MKEDDIVIDLSDVSKLSPDLQEELKLVGRYGVYDTKDNCWLGDETGPKVFEYFVLARIGAEVYSDQLGVNRLTCRFKAMELPAEENWKKKDEIQLKRTTLESLIRLENGDLRKEQI